MQGEHHVEGSTGGIALAYDPTMRNLLIPILLALSLSCGDDSQPTRPQDGSVALWESCVWDGQQSPELCEPELSCSSHGICSQLCETIADCPQLDGFDMDCVHGPQGTICIPMCNEAKECPRTGGAELMCFQSLCIRDP